MTYSEESLGQNEKLIYEAHFHFLYYAAAWISVIFCMALAIGALVYATGIAELGLLCISAAGPCRSGVPDETDLDDGDRRHQPPGGD